MHNHACILDLLRLGLLLCTRVYSCSSELVWHAQQVDKPAVMPATGPVNVILPHASRHELYISCRMHHVVLDEADLLLSGGFERDVSRILDGMKQSDRERKAQCLSQELGIPLEAFQALPKHVKAAAYEGAALRTNQ